MYRSDIHTPRRRSKLNFTMLERASLRVTDMSVPSLLEVLKELE
jgi:hypothetical protein